MEVKVCESGGEPITESVWVVRPMIFEGRPRQATVCVACDRRHPLNDLDWYNLSRGAGFEPCQRNQEGRS